LRQGLEIKQYLKHNSISRLLLGILIHELPTQFAPFFIRDSIMQSFVEKNESAFQTCASMMTTLYSAQTAFADSLLRLSDTIGIFGKCQSSEAAKCLEALKGNIKCEDKCPLIASLEAVATSAQQKNDLYGELQLKSLSKYLKTAKNVHWYKLYRAMITPRKGFWKGDDLEAISTFVATNSTEASEIVLSSVIGAMKCNAGLSSDVNAAKSSLSTTISKEWEEIKQSATKVNEARIKAHTAFQQIQFKFDDFHFDRIRENYNPLDIYLSNYSH